MNKLIVATIVAVMFVAVGSNAKQLVWMGKNMNFDQEYNWNNGLPHDGRGDVSYVDTRSDSPFFTMLANDSYNFGNEWKLPKQGIFKFSNDKDIIIKFNENAPTGNPVTFLGPREDEGFDFNCPKNWNLYNGPDSASTPQEDVPSEEDEVMFSSDSEYSVFSNQRLTNVLRVVLGNSFNGNVSDVISACENLPQYEFYGINCSDFEIDSQKLCAGKKLLYQGKCVTLNSCPTVRQLRVQNRQVILAAREYARNQRILLNTVVTRSINFVVPAEALSPENPAIIASILEGSQFRAQYATAIVALLQYRIWTINSLYIEVSEVGDVVIRGTVSGAAKYFLNAGEKVDEVTGDITAPSEMSDTSRFGGFLYNRALRAFPATASAFSKATINAAVAANCDSADVCNAYVVIDSVLVTSSDTTLLDVLNVVCPEGNCTSDVDALNAAFTAALGSSGSLRTITNIANTLAGAHIPEYVFTLLADSDYQLGQAASQTATSVPGVNTRRISVPILRFGRYYPRYLLQLLVNQNNVASFLTSMQTILLSRFQWTGISGLSFWFNNNNRRGTNDTETELFFSFTFTVECSANTCDSYNITTDGSSGDIVDFLTQLAELAAGLVDVEADACYVGDNSEFLTIPHVSCIQALVESTLNSDCDAACAVESIFYQVECGALGRAADGSCYSEIDPSVYGMVQDMVANAAESNSSSSQSSATSVGLIVGVAAGACILAIIIVLIAMKTITRKDESATASFMDDTYSTISARRMQGFQNPLYSNNAFDDDESMYEDGNKLLSSSGISLGDEDDEEGLYDLPIGDVEEDGSVMLARENPLYDSTENLAATANPLFEPSEDDTYDNIVDAFVVSEDEEEEEGVYQEMEDGGYMDVGGHD